MNEAIEHAVEYVDERLRLLACVGVYVYDCVKAERASANKISRVVPVALNHLNAFREVYAGKPSRKDGNIMAAPHEVFYRVAADVACPADDENFH